MRTFLAILLAAALIGCEAREKSHTDNTASDTDSATLKRNQYRLAVAAAGAEKIRDSMNDPESFKLTSAYIIDETGQSVTASAREINSAEWVRYRLSIRRRKTE